MACILFTWELGDNYGHLLAYRNVIQALLGAGHEISFCVKRLDYATQVYGSMPVRLISSPAIEAFAAPIIPEPDSYTEILLNTAFRDHAAAQVRMDSWRRILRDERPDLIVCSFSPGAMLANREYGAPIIASGNGFYTPPRCVPLPHYRYWQAADGERLRRHEDLLLQRMNGLLKPGAPLLQCVADLIAADATLLYTFPELDYFRDYPGREYAGIVPPEDFGMPPSWPQIDAPRVFAYLQPSPSSRRIIEALAERRVAAIIYCPAILAKDMPLPDAPHLRYTRDPVSMVQVRAECDIAINNANLATAANLLMAGRPQLLAPYTLEKYLVARRMESAGAALAVTVRDTAVGTKLDAVLTQRAYARGAERFANRYTNWTAARQCGMMRELIEALL